MGEASSCKKGEVSGRDRSCEEGESRARGWGVLGSAGGAASREGSCFSRDLRKVGGRTCECLGEEPSRQRAQQAQRPCGRSSLDIFKDARDASRLNGAGGVAGEQRMRGFREQLWVLFQV